MNRKAVGWGSTIAILMIAMVPGCGRQNPPGESEDTVADELVRMRNNRQVIRGGAQERVDTALSLWKNGIMDEQPVLIGTGLSEDRKSRKIHLGLTFFDERADALGVGVQEEYTAEDGSKRSIVEEYPVFVHRPQDGALSLRIVPVRIRDANQQKDSGEWLGYIRGETVDVSRTGNAEYYRETLPPVWVSIPDPNERDVRIFVYDRAGNKSDPVALSSSLARVKAQ